MLDQEIPNGKKCIFSQQTGLIASKVSARKLSQNSSGKLLLQKIPMQQVDRNAWFTNDSIRAIIAQSEPKGLKKIPVTIDPSNRNAAFTLRYSGWQYESEL
jgi:hypothetical protein